MRFWDSSAVIPLLVQEPSTATVRAMLTEDASMLAWRFTATEIVAALWRRRRADEISEAGRLVAASGLAALEVRWTTVEDVGQVDRRARRILAVHPLRTADALQLAAALVGCDDHPNAMPFVTLDGRLGEAARREGFAVLP